HLEHGQPYVRILRPGRRVAQRGRFRRGVGRRVHVPTHHGGLVDTSGQEGRTDRGPPKTTASDQLLHGDEVRQAPRDVLAVRCGDDPITVVTLAGGDVDDPQGAPADVSDPVTGRADTWVHHGPGRGQLAWSAGTVGQIHVEEPPGQ